MVQVLILLILRFVLHLEHHQEKREDGAQESPQIRVLSPLAGHDEAENARYAEEKQDEDQLAHEVQSFMW